MHHHRWRRQRMRQMRWFEAGDRQGPPPERMEAPPPPVPLPDDHDLPRNNNDRFDDDPVMIDDFFLMDLPVARRVNLEEEAAAARRHAQRNHVNAAGNHPNLNNNDANAEADDNDQIPMVAVQLLNLPRLPRGTAPPTSALLDEICASCASCSDDDCTRPESGCARIVARCRTHPEDVLYVCPHTRRQPCHQAALHCACVHVMEALAQAAHRFAATALRQDGRDVFRFDGWANTPLHLFFKGLKTRQWSAARVLPTLDVLLRATNPLTVTAPNVDGQTALHIACQGNGASLVPREAVERLLAAASPITTFHKINRRGEYPLHLHCARRDASVDMARLLMAGYPAALRATNDQGLTPLHLAASTCNGPLIEYLVQIDAHALRQRSYQDEVPLHLLCRHKPGAELEPALQRMVEAAPDVTAWKEARSGCTALHMLCKSPLAPLELVQALLVGGTSAVRVASQRANEPADELPLHVACRMGLPVAIIEALVQADPSTVRAVTRKKDTALSLACIANQSPETVQLLLSHHPKAAMMANDYGFLPIHCSLRTYQPHFGIVTALLEAAPSSLLETTYGGETALHLLSSNSSASAILFHDLRRALRQLPECPATNLTDHLIPANKNENTPLHHACFRGASTEQLEALIVYHPSWLTMVNAGGLTPLQLLCKSGHLDAEKVTLFSRLGGPGIFTKVDDTGNTPLHSALRAETDLSTLQALIDACPRALHMKTIYDDTPLHLACLRHVSPAMIHAVAVASCEGIEISLANCEQRISPILKYNTAGQTPVAIAMEEYLKAFKSLARGCTATSDFWGDQRRAFDVMSILVKLLHYGPGTMEETQEQNLIFACLCLHRKNVRLPPVFIRRAILTYPEQVGQADLDGSYPLHVEASIPVEKMSLFDASQPGCCGGECSKRSGILRLLLEIYPQASSQRNSFGYFPLSLMVQNGRSWDPAFTWVLRAHPEAFHWVEGVTPVMVPQILARVGRDCGRETLFKLFTSRPDVILAESSD